MARIPFPEPAKQPVELRDQLEAVGNLNIARMMSHAPALMAVYTRLGRHLLLEGTLDPLLREAVILRVGQLCRSDYEWHQHVSVARAIGMPEQILEAIEAERFDELPDDLQLGVRVTEELHHNHVVSPATFEAVRARFDEAQIVELMLLPGFYTMTAGYLRSLDIEVEEAGPLGGSFVQRETGAGAQGADPAPPGS